MKFIQKSSMLVVLCVLLTLTSCHRYGCPGQITDANKVEQATPVEAIPDENC